MVKLYEMDVLSSQAMDMSESLNLTIGYLLRDEHKDLESKSYNWIVNVRS